MISGDELVVVVTHIRDTVDSHWRQIQRLEAMLKAEVEKNRILFETNLRLKAEVDANEAALEAAREHADSLI